MAGRVAYYGNITTQGLILDLDAGRKDSYPRTGTSWIDISGNNNNGTLINSPTYSDGSIVFDGVNDYVNLNVPLETSNFSYNLWLKNPNSSSALQSLLGTYADQVTGGVMGFIGSGVPTFRISDGGGSFSQLSLVNVCNNEWKSITVSADRSGNAIGYVNGSPVNQLDISSYQTNVSVTRIGRIAIIGYLTGSLSSVKIYNQALTQFQVWQNFNAYKSRYGIPDIVTDGLVLNLDAGNPYSYLSGSSGTTWTDVSGNGNNGTLTNGALYANGAISFDKVDDYIEISDQIQFGQNDPFTLAAWINTIDADNNQIINNESTDYVGYQLTVGVSRELAFLFRNQQFPTIERIYVDTPASTIPTGEWVYVTATYDGSTNASGAKLYINGSPAITNIRTDTLAGDPNSGEKTWIGYRRPSTQGPFNGNISTVQIYNRALSASEIQQNFNALRGRYGI